MPAARKPRLEVNDRIGAGLPRGFLQRVVGAAVEFGGRPEMSISLLLTGEDEIAAIHERFLGDPSGTDVLSFPMEDGVDLVVSVERARREAEVRGHSFEAELALYVVHGILHVCGYDDTTARARARMRSAETELLASLGFAVAPVDD